MNITTVGRRFKIFFLIVFIFLLQAERALISVAAMGIPTDTK